VPDDILSAGGGFEGTVTSVRMLAPLIREIVVALPPDRAGDFRAGDFMQITAPPYTLDFSDIDVAGRVSRGLGDRRLARPHAAPRRP
jgi:Na+-transporting NADH:ubiquinone oxidoreductase subunit F